MCWGFVGFFVVLEGFFVSKNMLFSHCFELYMSVLYRSLFALSTLLREAAIRGLLKKLSVLQRQKFEFVP